MEGKSTCSNAETGGALGMMIGRPIAIHVSVSTTRKSDRDAGDLESEIADTEGSRAGEDEHGSVREDEFGTKVRAAHGLRGVIAEALMYDYCTAVGRPHRLQMYLISSPDEK